ncbi:Hypothetical protein NTJ_15308 [Nesidiocoris tenuis]|uniref:Uncharacterized protein n=1 Tax=Nesidiocoris tenuis TaxID=355587 RepID=A0ABN7BDN4_9HEMI|nr:Hypothetical protein NTJ_15308 [Nesidiocoris tenuis]
MTIPTKEINKNTTKAADDRKTTQIVDTVNDSRNTNANDAKQKHTTGTINNIENEIDRIKMKSTRSQERLIVILDRNCHRCTVIANRETIGNR